MRLPRFRLRTLMISIAFLALLMTVFMQYVQLQRAAAREERSRAEAERNRALAEASASGLGPRPNRLRPLSIGS